MYIDMCMDICNGMGADNWCSLEPSHRTFFACHIPGMSTHVLTRVHTHACTHVYTHAYTYRHVYTHAYTHAYTQAGTLHGQDQHVVNGDSEAMQHHSEHVVQLN